MLHLPLPRLLPLGLTILLAGCQFSLPGKGKLPDDVTPDAVIGDEIEVTALDAPPSEGAAPAGTDPADRQQSQSPAPPPSEDSAAIETTPPEPAPQPDLGDSVPSETGQPDAELPEALLADPVPEIEKSLPQIACEKKKGKWVKASAVLFACVFDTKDSGKSCKRGTQCEGDCLARSGTCAPFRPLLGCNEILQDDGTRATQCLE
ncbi:MAG TPA: hypothetical protein PKA03_06980 [Tabrizicola sp.]|nr:hypothetical protein [Tabrizicola sp.]